MEEFDRKFFKNDPVFYQLYQILKRNHRVPQHTVKTLVKNRHIKDFCEESTHFVELPGDKPIYLHYDVASWYHHKPAGIQVRIESIVVYDDFLEYEKARAKIIEGPSLN
jgi:hypothetical protein